MESASGALAVAARDYWTEKSSCATGIWLDRGSRQRTDTRIELEPEVVARVRAATSDEPEALLIVGMAALALLAERYTCAERPLLATADGLFAPVLNAVTTPRALINALSSELDEAEERAGWYPPPAPATLTGWGLTVAGLDEPAEWLRELELWVEWAGNSRLVIHHTWENLPKHYTAALHAVLTGPDRVVPALEILDEDDRRRLIRDHNSNATPYPDRTVATLFNEQVCANPDAIALIDCGEEERRWTYAELDEYANRLAWRLADRGLSTQEVVPVLGDRGARTVAGILAVLKAGGAYVPIDPESPAERIAAILGNLGARFALADRRYAGVCAGLEVVNLDVPEPSGKAAPPVPAPLQAPTCTTADSLAYVMYTSGSTGTPKGVMIPHRAIVRLVRNTNYIEMTREDRMLQTGSMAFDASTLEIWGALLNGGTLVLAPIEDLLDPPRLKDLLRHHGITVTWLTATWCHQLVDVDISIFAPLRHLLAGGERLSVRHFNSLRAAFPTLRITNGYGPTENTTFTTCHAIDRRYNEDIPIGRPVANTSVFVIDEKGRLAPEGAPGELCAGGAGLALGYLNAPALTAQKFLDNPFAPGERMYRTGDRARWRQDGALDFLGRLDDQIKLRGFRIEPGEIEAVLARHPKVSQAVVAMRNDRLAAWIVADDHADRDEIRDYACRHLPPWMLPAHYVFLRRLPLNANGKVDRAALLPADDQPPPVAPRTPLEARIAAVWEKVLERKPIGIRANFFELGGHSLKAAALIARLSREADLNISFRDLFRCPTVEQLAQLAEERLCAGDAPISATARAEAYAVSPAQRRLWILDQLDPGNLAYNMPACFRLVGPLDTGALISALRSLVMRHEILRTRFEARAGEPVQIVEETCYEPELVDISGEQNKLQRLRHDSAEEAARPFALDELPLFRVRLYRLGPEDHAFAAHLHHIIGDAWSSAILLSELASLYDAALAGAEPALAPLRIQYRDAAAWQNAQLDSGVLKQHLEYWKTHLAAPLPVLDLMTDFKRPPLQTLEGSTISFRLGTDRTRAFEKLRARLGSHNTPFVLLLGSVYVLLHRLSGQSDLIVGVPVAGRYHPDLHDQVGFYVNTLALRQRVDPEEAFGSLLDRVRETLAEAYDHQAYPFEQLVDELEIQRDVSRGAVFDVLVAYQEQEHFSLVLKGLRSEPVPIERRVSKCDLSFYFSQATDGLVCELECNTDLFAPETMERFGAHLFALIDDLAAREDASATPTGDLSVLDEKMYRRIMVDFNRTERSYPPGDTMVSLFEAGVAQGPANVAISYQEQEVTYAELNARANYIARCLREQHGVRRGDLVGVFRERTPDTVAALVGVLKAGAAYLPADPTYPAVRVKYLLEASGAKLLLSDAACAETAIASGYTTVLLEELPGEDPLNPPLEAGPEDLAYIIYTSGSTGTPKGVAIEHRQAATFLNWCREEFGNDFDVMLAGTSLCFDLSIFELFHPFTHARRVRLLASGLEVGDWLLRENRLVVNTVPSVMKDLVAAGADFSRAVMLNLAGEAIPLSLIEALQRACPRCPIRNLYGPSEDTTYSTCYRFPERSHKVLVGQAVANTDVYILDTRMRPVPIGVAGELFLAGSKLARGYLNDPELTREKFIPNPFYPARPYPRMYRVQDLARWTPDGNIEYLGRTDDQVKIRGFRIEPGEIEQALRTHPDVMDAAVVASGDFLEGFVVSETATTDALREFLAGTLPPFMVPARLTLVSQLPLTPHGKTDRRALRVLAARCDGDRGAVTPPRDAVERVLAGVWETVLGRATVGATDNFFDLGGHSLKATRLLAMAAGELGSAMPLKAFFAAPTIAAQADWYRKQRTRNLEPIPCVAPAGDYALSPAQLRLWVLAKMNPESLAYHMPAVFRIQGAVDALRLAQAFASIGQRHETLRTRFVTIDDEPRQVVDSGSTVALDFCRVDSANLDAAVRGVLERPFDLAREMPIRATLFQTEPDEFTLAFVMHHLACDGWSLNLLVNELLAAYVGESLMPLRIQYRDYAAWLNLRIERGELDGERAWWHRKLALPLPVLDLPTDFPRPMMQGYAGAEVAFEIDAALAARFHAACRANRATVFSGLLAVLQSLLYRYTGQEEIIVGTPASGRVHPDLDRQIGLYINTLALRGTPHGGETIAERLAAAQQETIDATAHQVYPFDRLVDDLKLNRDTGRSAVFDVMLVVEQEHAELALPGLMIDEARIEITQTKFDLTLYALETAQGLACRLIYNTALFRRQRMKRMARHFRNLLASASEDPSQTLASVDILDPGERALVVKSWNETAQAHPAETAITRFERMAAAMPDAPAVSCGAATLSYGELNAQANVLARWLKAERSVVPGDRVAVRLDGEEPLPEALLAIWKAGASYVPVDPANPEARIQLILADCGARTVLTSADLAAAACEGEARNPEPSPQPDDAAYVIYTSGTTGVPKGAMQPHSALVNYVCWLRRAFGTGPGDRAGLVSSYAFDLGYTALWGTLLNGGELVIAPAGIRRDPERMIEWMVARRLTYLKATPSLFEMLLESPSAGLFERSELRLILLGGEVLRTADVRRFLAIRPGTRFVNHYGPTETTIGSIAGELENLEDEPALGRPIDNTAVYIVDAGGQPAPVGVPGEIWIAGAGVGLGYLNERGPGRFGEDPFVPGQRLYRTGDRGRWTEDGRVEFLGRADSQAKVRGYRVDLREIEERLRDFPGVRKAAVMVEAGELSAGVASPGPISLEALRDFLAQRLPEYMIPASWAVMAQLPLTANGKIDSHALREACSLVAAARESVAPRNELEAQIARLWCEVLGRERPGVHDNFFHSGGHSLRAASLLSRVFRQTGVSLSLRDFFAAPTIEWIASHVRGRLHVPGAPPIERIPDADWYELSPAQERLWLLQHIDPRGLSYSMPAGFVLEGPLDPGRLRRAFEIIVARHETLRTVFFADDGRPKQQVLAANGIVLCEEDLRGDNAMKTALAWQKDDVARAFDLSRGPLIRLHLLRTDDEQWVLLLNMHHIVSDGWSMGLLAAELVEAYRNPEEESLVPLEIQYRDIAAWQRQRNVSRDARDYWLENFREPLDPLDLPADRPRPAVQDFSGDRVTWRIRDSCRRRIEGLVNGSGATLFMVLTAGVQALLSRYTGQNDICVGTAVAGRSRPEFEKLIGFFVQTLALRSRIDPAQSFGEFLGGLRQTVLGALDHADYHFAHLVDELGIPRDLSRNPLFDVMVVLQNTDAPVREFSGIRAIPLEPPRGTAKFDLNFVFTVEDKAIRLDLEYATALFDRKRIERLCRHLETLLDDAAANPARSIMHLRLMPDEEEEAFLSVSRGEAIAVDEATLIDRFERQVARTPDAIAVEFAGGQLTFSELNEEANRVARALLREYPLKPDDLVALTLPRSHWMVIAILGVWKTGAAWLPVDPSQPAERVRMLAAHARTTLTEADIFRFAGSADDEHTGNPKRECGPRNLAYVLFTSGSTGEPKGCMVEHRNIRNYIDWAARVYPGGTAHYGLHSPITFDLTLTSLLCPLVRGETLRIYAEDASADHMLLDTFNPASPVNFVKLTPSHISLLNELPAGPSNVSVAVVGGEAMTSEHVEILYRFNPQMRVINEYGPTETAVGAMWYEAGRGDTGPISIGRPIQNTEVLILDQHFNPLPEGITGEICIGGAPVGRGYLRREDLTAERFAEYRGGRIYRTGDFGRWDSSGFTYLGRRDVQVKIRGHRVELGEIESALSRCSGVRQAAAGIRGGVLMAWIAGDGAQAPDEGRLTSELSRLLPDYMLPARIVTVSEIPVTANGKTDRNALPDPDCNSCEMFDPPATRQERALAGVWSALLSRPHISRHDNFFHLGGDSIRAVQMFYRLRETGWALEVPSLFASPTLAEAARRMRAVERRAVRHPAGNVFPVTPIQEWFFATQRTGRNHFNQSVLLSVPSDVSKSTMEDALAALVAHHEALRLRFRTTERGVIQWIDVPHRVELPLVDESAMAELHASLDIESGPMLRAALVRCGDGVKLLIVIHHLAVDGYSWRILLEDLDSACGGAALPPPTDSFGAWAEALGELRAKGLPAAEVHWWKSISDFGYESPPYPASCARRLAVKLTPVETRELTGPAGRAYKTTPQDLLLAALAAAVREWTGNPLFRVFLESHGRESVEGFDVSRTVGWFTSRYPVLLDVHETEPGRLLKGVKEALRAVPHQGAGFGILRPEYRSGGISFNYLGQFDAGHSGRFKLLAEESGPNVGSGALLPHELSVVAAAASGELAVEFTWPEGRWDEREMAKLADRFLGSARTLLAHCNTAMGEATPSDFTYKGLSPDDLESVFDGD